MPEKDPTNWAVGTWILAIAMSIGGGLVNWWAKVKQGHTRVFNVVELIGEVFTSGFVGVGVFMLLSGLEYPQALCAACSGISGHMGTRLLFAIERAAERRLNAMAEQAGK